MTNFLTVEDSPQLAAGSFKPAKLNGDPLDISSFGRHPSTSPKNWPQSPFQKIFVELERRLGSYKHTKNETLS